MTFKTASVQWSRKNLYRHAVDIWPGQQLGEAHIGLLEGAPVLGVRQQRREVLPHCAQLRRAQRAALPSPRALPADAEAGAGGAQE